MEGREEEEEEEQLRDARLIAVGGLLVFHQRRQRTSAHPAATQGGTHPLTQYTRDCLFLRFWVNILLGIFVWEVDF